MCLLKSFVLRLFSCRGQVQAIRVIKKILKLHGNRSNQTANCSEITNSMRRFLMVVYEYHNASNGVYFNFSFVLMKG